MDLHIGAVGRWIYIRAVDLHRGGGFTQHRGGGAVDLHRGGGAVGGGAVDLQSAVLYIVLY